MEESFQVGGDLRVRDLPQVWKRLWYVVCLHVEVSEPGWPCWKPHMSRAGFVLWALVGGKC